MYRLKRRRYRENFGYNHCRVGVWCLSLEYCTYIYTYTCVPCYFTVSIYLVFIPPDWSVFLSLLNNMLYFVFFERHLPLFSVEEMGDNALLCMLRRSVAKIHISLSLTLDTNVTSSSRYRTLSHGFIRALFANRFGNTRARAPNPDERFLRVACTEAA